MPMKHGGVEAWGGAPIYPVPMLVFSTKIKDEKAVTFPAQRIKFELQQSGAWSLNRHRVDKVDRKFQIWKRCSLSKPLYTLPFWFQKVNYIHLNPCRYKTPLAIEPEEYRYSSANYFFTGVKD